jgi:EAL domain-containing protein (putative c-di-GMP-specific phosphodiesterase class I)
MVYHEKLINEIDEAIANRDLIVYYQPKYGIQGNKPVLKSAEALIRWKHPERGMISPGDFIPLFESNGLIQKLDNYVWEEAAHQIRKWKEKYGRTIPVSVNVSRIDIYDPALESKLLKLIDTYDITTKDLLLEITESAYADNADTLSKVVESLRGRGFKIEMDDFGSGYSSLNMLTTITIDVIKIDMKFIRNMRRDDKSLRMVKLIIDIAGFLNVPVVAEGVEDEVQLNALKKMGCDLIQGFYFSRPVPPDEFEKFIEQEL